MGCQELGKYEFKGFADCPAMLYQGTHSNTNEYIELEMNIQI